MITPEVTLIISMYKNIEALELILKSVEKQNFKDFDVIIAEDNDSPETASFIERMKHSSSLTIQHVFQSDEGFLKTKALNKAVALSNSPYIIFIDGDCILHQSFIKEHVKNKEQGMMLYGRRVMLSDKLTKEIYRTKDLSLIKIFNMIKDGCTKVEEAFYLPFLPSPVIRKSGIWGCNWSVHKSDLLEVNGYDEDFQMPGFGEDTDIEYRLFKIGVQLKKIKHKAIQYHLHHAIHYTNTDEMKALMQSKIVRGQTYCLNGIDKYLNR